MRQDTKWYMKCQLCNMQQESMYVNLSKLAWMSGVDGLLQYINIIPPKIRIKMSFGYLVPCLRQRSLQAAPSSALKSCHELVEDPVE